MNVKKLLYIILGCISVGLGAIGAVVPMLPAFPFLLLAAFCFARSSKRLHGQKSISLTLRKKKPGTSEEMRIFSGNYPRFRTM